jgi:hypothetical protein
MRHRANMRPHSQRDQHEFNQPRQMRAMYKPYGGINSASMAASEKSQTSPMTIKYKPRDMMASVVLRQRSLGLIQIKHTHARKSGPVRVWRERTGIALGSEYRTTRQLWGAQRAYSATVTSQPSTIATHRSVKSK